MRKVFQIFFAALILIIGIFQVCTAEKNSPVDAERKQYHWTWLGKAPLSDKKIDAILSIKKGERPNPKTYLTRRYIAGHLNKFRKGGVSIVMSRESYLKFVEPSETIGRDDGCFVMPKYVCDDIAKAANGNAAVFELALSFDVGYFSEHGGMVRVDVPFVNDLNLRIPSGNEGGANSDWLPGGYTKGGVPEAVCDKIPKSRSIITEYFH